MRVENVKGKFRMNNDGRLTLVIKLDSDKMSDFVVEKGLQPSGMIDIIIRSVTK